MALIRKHGKVPWSQVELPSLNLESLSTGTCVLSRGQGAKWMENVPTITGGWLTNNGNPAVNSTCSLSTGAAQMTMLMERTEPNGPAKKRVRYYEYAFVWVADGRVFQAGPDKDVDAGHHQSKRPGYLDSMYQESTSTGW